MVQPVLPTTWQAAVAARNTAGQYTFGVASATGVCAIVEYTLRGQWLVLSSPSSMAKSLGSAEALHIYACRAYVRSGQGNVASCVAVLTGLGFMPGLHMYVPS